MSVSFARHWRPIALAAVAALGVAAMGAWTTNLGGWYYSLLAPVWKPPDWLFGPAWTLIFGCAALAAALGWQHARQRYDRQRLLWLFVLNAGLNILWSVLFFRLQRPDWALGEVVFLWLSITALILILFPLSKTASWLMVPYLAWVTFAALLNLSIVRLNYPFHPPT